MTLATSSLVVGNWKMNGLRGDLAELEAIAETAGACGSVEVALALPATLILAASAAFPTLSFGAQDIHAQAGGAFTGGVSGAMIRDAGGRFTLAGHSERRAGDGDTDAQVKVKVEAARRDRLSAILCVGEDAALRDAGRAEHEVGEQLRACLPRDGDGLVVAYEPVWAIGTGRTPTLDQIASMHEALRRTCVARLGATGGAVRLLYGGSVTAANAGEILALDNVDGVLVGGASLRAETFTPIIQAAQALAARSGRPWQGLAVAGPRA
ncbi:triose-phosphate isomerase [Caulobacter sp. RL271]|uniref:Triosephosphate isomerase n=1 Tax=Caulobacter segnis TaxID=88688 RepID=A0ABY4ZX44_9CAUL|nr:triose-phosphate isomerase [Caulobacter segnis]USQ97351.1 triose-phosphate isomerase [Caulobacter segnis]